MERYTKADLNDQPSIGARVLEDLKRILEVELLIDRGRRVDLNTVESEGLLIRVEELGSLGASGQVPVREEGEEYSECTLDNEKPSPRVEMAFDLEDAEGEKT